MEYFYFFQNGKDIVLRIIFIIKSVAKIWKKEIFKYYHQCSACIVLETISYALPFLPSPGSKKS